MITLMHKLYFLEQCNMEYDFKKQYSAGKGKVLPMHALEA